MTYNKGMNSSESDLWATPWNLFTRLNHEFGFSVDVCASEDNTKCARYFDEEIDGLAQCWSCEVAFCNPPYGDVSTWVEKARDEARDCGATVVMLVKAATSEKWWHRFIWDKKHRPRKGVEVRFPEGRIKFELPGKENQSAPFPSAIVVFRGGQVC